MINRNRSSQKDSLNREAVLAHGERLSNQPELNQAQQRQQPAFPFTALVGQEELKLSLLLCVTDPTIGGVLVMGHRGTAKSTAVRSLAALLPPLDRVTSCPYNCDPLAPSPVCPHCAMNPAGVQDVVVGSVPVVDLPLGATEDRVAGSLDVERALVEGVQAFAPGLLARANRGFLYIDEVNLLEDHLVDLLLDVAASGVNVVEREGISIRHPARFVLVGSGNPEEGDLRPQLLDRFGLHARITTITDIDERVEIVRRRRAYDSDPLAFAAAWEPEQEKLRQQLLQAQRNLAQVDLTDATIEAAARLCVALEVDGHRGELTLCRTAVALAALDGRSQTEPEDIARVATLSLQHRLRKDPLESVGDDERVKRAVAYVLHPQPVATAVSAPEVVATAVNPAPTTLQPDTTNPLVTATPPGVDANLTAVQDHADPVDPLIEPTAVLLPTFAPDDSLPEEALADLLVAEEQSEAGSAEAWSENDFDDLWQENEANS
ncbi:MAG: magnesium chelatase ATPase subunit I [Chloroflexi bacterium]|nr:magnesium chelatase ATPase subunit I [Chloroflexota bacterium]